MHSNNTNTYMYNKNVQKKILKIPCDSIRTLVNLDMVVPNAPSVRRDKGED